MGELLNLCLKHELTIIEDGFTFIWQPPSASIDDYNSHHLDNSKLIRVNSRPI